MTAPVVAMDYGVLGPRDQLVDGDSTDVKDMITFCACRDRVTKCIASHAMPCKGPAHEYPPKRIIKTLDEWGRADVTLKSDGEPAIVQVQNAVKDNRNPPTICQNHRRMTCRQTARRRARCRRS